jgi:signal transduction histidine kinase
MASGSLLTRITLRVSLVTLLMSVATYAWAYYQIRISADHVNEGSLVAQVKELADSVVQRDGEITFTLPDDLVAPADEHNGIFRYSVRNIDGTELFGSSWHTTMRDDLPKLARRNHLYETEHSQPSSDTFVGSVAAVDSGDVHLLVQVERASSDLGVLTDTILDEYFAHGAWFDIPFLIAILFINVWTIRRAFIPLSKLSAEAKSIGPLSSEVRLKEENVPTEILPLVRAMNSALDRLHDGFRAQREFTADTAHELRTPLAVLSAHIETLDDREVARSLGADIDVVTRVVSNLLKDAQLDALAITSMEIAELSAIATSVRDLLASIAARDDKKIVLSRPAGPIFVRGNDEAIFYAVRNLVENALRFTAPGGVVEIDLKESGSIQVTDHGPGIQIQNRQDIFTRFWRGADRTGGAGLGLSIVKKTMEIHNGSIEVSETPGGGATFRLTFLKAAIEDDVS